MTGAGLTAADLRAVRTALLWALNGDGFLDDWMKEHGCGRNWHSQLRRAAEKMRPDASGKTE